MFEIKINNAPTYDPIMVQPMREEVTQWGIKELHTAEEVDEALKLPGTTMIFVNSVCGCAAGMARPALSAVMKHGVLPDRVVSVFAGMEKAAVARAREHMAPFPPSSPSFGLFKDGKLVSMLERRQIEGHSGQQVAEALVGMIMQHPRS